MAKKKEKTTEFEQKVRKLIEGSDDVVKKLRTARAEVKTLNAQNEDLQRKQNELVQEIADRDKEDADITKMTEKLEKDLDAAIRNLEHVRKNGEGGNGGKAE